jgi:hypothetical protein
MPLIVALKRDLSALLRLVVEKKAVARVHVAFGAELPPGTSIETKWGILRPWRETDSLVFSGFVDHQPDRGSVLDTVVEMDLNVLPDDDPGRIHIAMLDDERWQRLALALLLAQPADKASPTEPWAIMQEQVLAPGANGGSAQRFRKGPSFAAEHVSEISSWLERVANPALSRIAVFRLTSMVQRFDNVDAFIDGVIVWENLFGTGDTQELSYRVSTNMACVLSDDNAARVPLQAELKKLYTLRSRVVHGGRHLSAAEAGTTRARAQVLTIEAMQRLLANHAELVSAKAQDFMAFVLGAPMDQ